MYEKILHLGILSILIYEKIFTIKWLKSIRHQLSNYEKVKDYFIIQRFVTYTSVGNNLAILCSFYSLLFNTQPDKCFFILTWNTLFSVTFGYWILIFPKSFNNNEPQNYLSEFLSHGPGLFFYSLLAKYYQIDFDFEYVIYPILLGYFYLFFIWYPWYKITDDTIYVVMKNGWLQRIFTIFTMNCFSFLGYLLYQFI